MTATFYVGDAIEVMSKLPEKSVDLVLTSPPFLALRSYLPADHPDKPLEGGSQSTPGEFIDWLLDVVEACARVLAPHGSLCFELGDTYADSGGPGGDYNKGGLREGQPKWDRPQKRFEGNKAIEAKSGGGGRPRPVGPGWAMAKSLSLVPESFRWAMVYGMNPFTGRTTDRWRLRNVIRWVRPNPPVGALGDKFRPATSELMVFCKSATRFFDLDAVRYQSDYHRASLYLNKETPPGQRPNMSQHTVNAAGAPPLDWWSISPANYKGAHYAVWPPALLEKPIKAMCPLGGTVLDPFVGSGTTLAVASGLGRNAIGIDLDARNFDLALDRVGPFILSKGAA